MMDFRNAQYNRNGGIDCEIDHPNFGWMPFTAASDDVEAFGRELFSAMQDVALPYVAPPPSAADVNAERDRRLAADFEFMGKLYQRDVTSLQRITGAATLAGFAMAAGAQAGNLRWANPSQDFGWIASDNTITPMDAPTCFAFGQAAASVETRIVFAAKALRTMNPIPQNFADDEWWNG